MPMTLQWLQFGSSAYVDHQWFHLFLSHSQIDRSYLRHLIHWYTQQPSISSIVNSMQRKQSLTRTNQ
ncbi:hypothetical protein BLOT_007574 [Blomia tropicalis]|nr:hypothetical protein BLOT_007574 [Blomia tropicalis]